MPEPVFNLPREVWASIPGHPGYWVSSEGRVRSRRGILKRNPRHSGHLAVDLPGRKTVYVHRLVALAFIPNPDGLPMVMHGDDDPSNNRVANLSWGTAAQNNADAWARGRNRAKRAAPHGSRPKYQRGCRCPACTAANTEFDRQRRATNPRFVEQQRAAKRRHYLKLKEANRG